MESWVETGEREPEPESQPAPDRQRLPPWLKRPVPSRGYAATTGVVRRSDVATVCREAKCPNVTECWANRHATFMILGDRCTRGCRFCAVERARPDPPAADEPMRLARAVGELGLRHVVITAVARDDLEDEGAGHFARCVAAIHETCPGTTVEVLPADFHARRECVQTVCDAGPEVFNHNLEVVERLTPMIRPQAAYARSLEVLRLAKSMAPAAITKSGLLVGLGETEAELRRTFEDLRAVGCDVLTVGQYLAPSLRDHAPVVRYYPPAEFEALGAAARSLGFLAVASGPFVRSSYHAAAVFEESRRRQLGSGVAPGINPDATTWAWHPAVVFEESRRRRGDG